MKHLLKMSDLSPAELHHILDVAEELKAEQKAGTTPGAAQGQERGADVLQKFHPHPPPALRWGSTSWAVWATT